MRIMNKNVLAYSIYSIFASMTFETPIFFVFMVYKGLEYSQITMLFSFYAVAVIIFEYLTGVLADRYSRKGIVIFSGL